ncbi:response regulator [Pedobacter suwonensis]|uniref:response regulator n=1 Tax=Pedobacter suwonensis TaxID=332999 RepID=UPI0025E7792F|nr:response regulator [uncultured Pedobacter sp.]
MEHRPVSNLAKIRFAIADDSEIQHLFIDAFAKRVGGFDLVFSALNGADLLDGLGQLECLPQLCILDLHMPVMDGIESARQLRERYPSIILFGCTASEDPGEIVCMLENGVRKVYAKKHAEQIFWDFRHQIGVCTPQ